MPKKLNVIQIIDSLAVGGAEMMAVNIANGLDDKSINSHICVTRQEGLLKQKIKDSVGYLFLKKKGSVDVRAVLNLKKYIKKHHIEIIHAHSSSFFIAILIKIITPSIRVIWHDHYGKANEIEKRKTFFLKLGSLLFKSILSVNQILYKWAKDNLHTKDVNYLANFSELIDINLVTQLKGVEGKRIICLAAFRPQKDHLNLLKSFVFIKNKYPDWTLHLIGNHQKDTCFKGVQNFIEDNNLKSSVFIYNACLDVKNVLTQASIGVLSSKSEGLPLSLLEYGLAGLPVVVTNVGECKNVVGDNGLVVEKQNSKNLSLALEKYIINNNFRKEVGQKFQHHIDENYSKSSYFTNLLSVYNQ
ncbi:glycosyltransferase involved in cell wall biosynthesis [Wenyingzhuangia heitensis]|uniref:Glycosyltransferase involved in cell wall biosynthesis n=1 Tax=Wenyingzhuangia heitensis TaxID=1487859 RepID=A0ABX0U9L2_9FLAO|nr:glycosyltransferase [Wenyingzhuangia heitensis]NIJ45443.1 glycosyltransferase involved in cell wall biosynthesis [Wenyingzhuangia heitensis]